MKKLLFLLLCLITTSLFSNMSLSLGSRVITNDQGNDFVPSLYWDMGINNTLVGMTYSFDILNDESNLYKREKDWFLDWEATIDIKHCFFDKKGPLVPYGSLSLGTRSINQLETYKDSNTSWKKESDGTYSHNGDDENILTERSYQRLAITGKLAGGIDINFTKFYIGAFAGVKLYDGLIFEHKELQGSDFPYYFGIQTGYRIK